MQIQITTGNVIGDRESLNRYVEEMVRRALQRSREQVTRVEVHLSDENGLKGGSNDNRCVIEARLANRQPVAVIFTAASLNLAVEGAVARMSRLVGNTLDRRATKQQAGRRDTRVAHLSLAS